MEIKEKRDFLEKENNSFKDEILKFSKKISFGSKTLEYMLPIQVSHYNKSGLDFERKVI